MFVYVIDDDPGVLRTLGRAVRQAGWQPSLYSSADEFWGDLWNLEFGPVLLDINMPGLGGLGLLERMSSLYPEWPVVIVSGTSEVSDAIRSFRGGAVHMLQKPFRAMELQMVLNEAVRIGEQRRAEAERKRRALDVKLSKREREVLCALAAGQTNKVIASQLGISLRTVEMHRANLLSKLSAQTSAQAVVIAKECGLLSVEDVR